MKVWIDATDGKGAVRVFGMSLVERILRGFGRMGLEPDEIAIELSADASLDDWVPKALQATLPLRARQEEGAAGQRLRRFLERAGGAPVLALSADCVVDHRLLAALAKIDGSRAFLAGQAEGRRAMLRVERAQPGWPGSETDLLGVAEAGLQGSHLTPLEAREFDSYIVSLRRELAPYLRRVESEHEVAETERFLFRSNYKGSTDFMTKYVYPPLVWQMLGPLARRRVHPNWVTAVDIVATVAAIPFFAAGLWLPGLLLAYLMSVLDSVDGKLARLTYRDSRLGELLDHGLDLVHPPFWYLAWGWALGGGVSSSGPFRAALLMFGLYVADRVCAPLFKSRTGRSIHGYTPFDVRMRTFISRRNVNLPLFTAAVALDAWQPGLAAAQITFYAIVAWQAFCLVFHADRVFRFWDARSAPPPTPQPGELAASRE